MNKSLELPLMGLPYPLGTEVLPLYGGELGMPFVPTALVRVTRFIGLLVGSGGP